MLKNGLKKLGTKLLDKFHSSKFAHQFLSIAVENMLASLRGKKVRFGASKEAGFFAIEDNRKLYFINMRRGFWLYRDGINEREEFIFKSYCLQHISFAPNDVVLDCGANAGDLFLRLSKIIGVNGYHAFEPNPHDFSVLKRNVIGSENLFDVALGDVDSELVFYTATSGGDSSLVEPENWDEKIVVKAIRLDSFMTERRIPSVKLLKLEAEGFEPEILLGLGSLLKSCEYIAVDGGYERGPNREQTLTACTNYLLANGFEMVDIYFAWSRALYRRK